MCGRPAKPDRLSHLRHCRSACCRARAARTPWREARPRFPAAGGRRRIRLAGTATGPRRIATPTVTTATAAAVTGVLGDWASVGWAATGPHASSGSPPGGDVHVHAQRDLVVTDIHEHIQVGAAFGDAAASSRRPVQTGEVHLKGEGCISCGEINQLLVADRAIQDLSHTEVRRIAADFRNDARRCELRTAKIKPGPDAIGRRDDPPSHVDYCSLSLPRWRDSGLGWVLQQVGVGREARGPEDRRSVGQRLGIAAGNRKLLIRPSALTQSEDSQRPADVRMLGAWLRSSVRWSRPRIVLVSRRSSPIATAPRSTWRGLGSSSASADRLTVAEVARRAGVGRPAVWRWQRRFAEAGVDGPAARRHPQARQGAAGRADRAPGGGADLRRAARRGDPLDRPGHGQDGRRSRLRSVQRIWAGARSAAAPHPHLQALERSRLRRQARGHRRPVRRPAGACGRCSRSTRRRQIQALDRTQPGLPLKPGKAGTMTHDYKRNGTTTLFAALNVLDGTVHRPLHAAPPPPGVPALPQRHRARGAGRQGDPRDPRQLRQPTSTPRSCAWLARHPRWTFHFTPTSGSWLNAVETFFSALTRRRLRRGSFHSIVDLQAAINRYIAEHNHDPKPFTWTKTAGQILAKLNRLNASVH